MIDNLSAELLVAILRDCVKTTIYPAGYAQAHGIDRAMLDRHLDHLRLKGLLSLTDWAAGTGQGYAITPAGQEFFKHVPEGGPAMIAAIQLAMHEAKAPAPVHPSAPPPSSSEVQEDLSGHRRESTWTRGERVRDALVHVPTPYVTYVIVALNVLAFVAGAIVAESRGIPLPDYLFGSGTPQMSKLYEFMGSVDQSNVIVLNQWWRLFAYCFLHGGLIHLSVNMYFLYSIGPRLEGMWGRWRYIFLYVLSGIAGGVAVVVDDSAAIGASGALCGLLGSLVFWIWLNREHLGPDVTQMFLRNVIVNIVMIAAISMLPFVSGAGHFGGGLAGLIVAYPMVFNRFGTRRERWLGLLGMIAVALVVVGIFLGDRQRLLHPGNNNAATSSIYRITFAPAVENRDSRIA